MGGEDRENIDDRLVTISSTQNRIKKSVNLNNGVELLTVLHIRLSFHVFDRPTTGLLKERVQRHSWIE